MRRRKAPGESLYVDGLVKLQVLPDVRFSARRSLSRLLIGFLAKRGADGEELADKARESLVRNT